MRAARPLSGLSDSSPRGGPHPQKISMGLFQSPGDACIEILVLRCGAMGPARPEDP